jgi:NAD(P)-dependent dehydrogenase (short-subunit alcohol dehydrogenase family)
VGGDVTIKPYTPEEWEEMRLRRMARQTMKTRRVSADDVAAAVAFFASAESDLITGQHLAVDGGSFYY